MYNLQICNLFPSARRSYNEVVQLCENGYDPARIGSDISGRDVTRVRCVSTLGEDEAVPTIVAKLSLNITKNIFLKNF